MEEPLRSAQYAHLIATPTRPPRYPVLPGRIYFAGENRRAASPGALYRLDLAGACLGAPALGAFLIPVYGFLYTAVLMVVVNLAPAGFAAACCALFWPPR